MVLIKLHYLKIFFILISIFSFDIAVAIERHIFLVDISGSMEGTPMSKARTSMQNLAKQLFINGDIISIVTTEGACTDTPKQSEYFNNIQDLVKEINSITTAGGNSIPVGFKYAQEQMRKNAPNIGHVYLFGDGDGKDLCEGMQSLADKYRKKGSLAPFTYIGLDWTEKEKKAWNELLKKNGGVAYDYNEPLSLQQLSSSTQKKVVPKKKPIYFKKVEYLDKLGNVIAKKDYSISPWHCVKSDGLIWYVAPKSEQKTTYILKKETGKSNCKENCSPNQKYKDLESVSMCGQKDWRIPDINELDRVASLKKNKLDSLFPYLRYWPHISSSGGSYSFNKGINFESSQVYDYRKDKPYSALFVFGNVGGFVVPEEMLNTRVSEVLSNNRYILPKKKNISLVPAPQTSTKLTNTVINIGGIDVDFVEVDPKSNLVVSKYEVTYQLFEKYVSDVKVATEYCVNHNGNDTSTWKTPGYTISDKNIPVTCILPKDIEDFIKWANKNSSPKKTFAFINTGDWVKMTGVFVENKDPCHYNLLDYSTITKLGRQASSEACKDDGYNYSTPVNKLKDLSKLVGLRGNVRELLSDCSSNNPCKYKVSGGSWRSNNGFNLMNAPIDPENDLGFRIKIN